MKLNLILVILFSFIGLPLCFAAPQPRSFLASPFAGARKLKEVKFHSPKNTIVAAIPETIHITPQTTPPVQIPQALKLLIGAGGIYAAFLYYGTLQEEVFHYVAEDGTKFTQAWFLQALGKLIVVF
jgi:hypothetical protein